MLARSPDRQEDVEAVNNMAEDIAEIHINEDDDDNSDSGQEGAFHCDDKALKMMEKMGYKQGTGLGKDAQGIKQIIDVTYQLSSKGFGMKLKKFGLTISTWDFSKDDVEVEEHLTWLTNWEESHLHAMAMHAWLREGDQKNNIDDEVDFCKQKLLHGLIKAKQLLDEMDEQELYHARSRSNPFEAIKSLFFMNRAALKMANIDAATDFIFTKINENQHFRDSNGPFYFADVCAGPGGFSEYILWRKKWLFKGFGLTLKDDQNDFKLYASKCASSAPFQALYGADEKGNVCNPDNIKHFRDRVVFAADRTGVHFMMSDGGFSVEGNEHLQEVLSKNIYVCQCLVALEIVREHGHFVTKLFDCFTPFTVGLIYLMYKCFEKITIMKPKSSRPANSERYFICSDFRNNETVRHVKLYLWEVVNKFWELRQTPGRDILEIVPLEMLKSDKQFYTFICDTNNGLAAKQIQALKKLTIFCQNPMLYDPRQKELKRKCLTYWDLPERLNQALIHQKPEDLLKSITNRSLELFLQPRRVIDITWLPAAVENPQHWHYCCSNTNENVMRTNIYAAIGNSSTYHMVGDTWIHANGVKLYRGTVLYGELVKESCLAHTGEYKKPSLHVIDALQLGDKYLGNLSFSERQESIQLYCRSINKEYRNSEVRIRSKPLKKLNELYMHKSLSKINSGISFEFLPKLGYRTVGEGHYVHSLLLVKSTDDQCFFSTFLSRVRIILNDPNANYGNRFRPRVLISDIIREVVKL